MSIVAKREREKEEERKTLPIILYHSVLKEGRLKSYI